ncbi:MAG: CotH kinase family protein [Bacteroidaceae bacterium]
MKRTLHLFLFIFVFYSGLAAQNLLGGTPISSTPHNYGSGLNVASHAFDGDYSTFFASYERTYTWVGLDLGSPHIITKVAFSPRIAHEYRLLLGVIEGSNRSDFLDAVPLHIIDVAPRANTMTEATIDCSKGFRYVRYVGPNDARCNIAELKFFGYASVGDDSHYPLVADLPVVSIHTADATDVTSKEYYLEGFVSFISDGGSQIFTSVTEIKGRGNYSWGLPKKPYKLKLEKSTQLLDFPAKAKKWTLINNYGDKTLMRNLLAFEISKRFGMAYTPAGKPVDVFLNGEYKGCYQLCDQIDVRPGRVDVVEMKKKDIALPQLSGGYLIEIDAYADRGNSWFTSSRGMPVTIKSPDDDDIKYEQSSYIKNYFNQLEAAVFSYQYTNPSTGYRSLLDIDSFLKHFIIGELTGNTDTYWSVYMYKDRESDKFFTGPAWDFDLAFENDNRTFPINNLSDYICLTKGSAVNNMRNFVKRILSDDNAQNDLERIWTRARYHDGVTADELLEVVEDYSAKITNSAHLNFLRWPILNQYVHQNPRIAGSYAGEVDFVKEYIRQRIDWLDNKIGLNADGIEQMDSKGSVYAAYGEIHFENFSTPSDIHIYDMLGRLVATRLVNSIDQIKMHSGLYVVKMQTGSITYTQKVLVP